MTSLYLCLLYIILFTYVNSELVNVHVLFRHGDRSPVVFLPKTYSSASKDWPMGPGQLTLRGMQQQFQLGSFLKEHYGNLVGHQYSPLKVHIRSTDMDRTLMSAQANLAGLFMPDNSTKLWNKNLLWFPVPVHTVSGLEDVLLTDAKCPRIHQVQTEIYNMPDVKKIRQENAKFFAQLKDWSGLEVDLKSIWKIYDYLFCVKAHNFTTPNWNTPEVWKRLHQLNTINWKLMFYNEEIRRLKLGILVHHIMRHIHRIRSGKQLLYGRKMMMYSGHDTDVAGILSMVGLFNDSVQPSYASCIMIELHRNLSGLTDDKTESSYYSWFIRFHYRNASGFYTFQLPGCPSKDCPLHKWKKLLSPYNLKSFQRKEECTLKENHADVNNDSEHSFLVPGLIIFLVVALIFSVICGFFIVRRMRVPKQVPLIEEDTDVY